MSSLSDRTALVTGASQGIGRAVALELAAAGATVWLASRGRQGLESTRDAIVDAGGRAEITQLDLSDPSSITSGLEPVLAAGGVHVLVNNAGVTADGLILRMSDEQWQTVIDTNLTGSMRVTRALLKPMLKKRWGRIVFLSSVVGQAGNAGQANYAAAKAGLLGLTKALALELASRSITVNAVCPGYVETAMTEALDEAQRETLLSRVPLNRMGQPEDIAAGVSYLCSEGAGYVTGQVLNINGGMYV
ncbi:MAG: 3-oxoacyl-[acyl-carrier-protein] reductase [Acidobacteriota bacterium]